MGQLESSDTITLARRHDLCIRVVCMDGTETSVLASSAAMSLASPVWDAMLNPENGFQESKSKEVDFSDDNEEALLLLLRIAHLQYSTLPIALTFEQLDQLAILCDKYDTVTLVRPWLEKWVTTELKSFAGLPGYERWLFVAYTLGFTELFEKTATFLVFNCKTNKSGQCLTAIATPLAGDFPLGIIGMSFPPLFEVQLLPYIRSSITCVCKNRCPCRLDSGPTQGLTPFATLISMRSQAYISSMAITSLLTLPPL